MKSSDKTCKYAHLDRLSTPELEEILRADLAQPDSEDTDMVLYIMEVIEQRENKKTEESIAGTNRAWKEFQEIYNTPEGAGQSLYPTDYSPSDHAPATAKKSTLIRPPKRSHQQFHRFLATAAVLTLAVLFLAPPALGYESIYQMIGHWTEQIFHFETSPGSENSASGHNGDDSQENPSGEYATLQEALEAYGLSADIVPSQVPEGFELVNLNVSEALDFGKVEFSAYYEKTGSPLTVFVVYHNGEYTYVFEKDGMPVEEYISGEITFYLFENLGQQVAAWYTDSCECSISGDISRDEMKTMVDSISVR